MFVWLSSGLVKCCSVSFRLGRFCLVWFGYLFGMFYLFWFGFSLGLGFPLHAVLFMLAWLVFFWRCLV